MYDSVLSVPTATPGLLKTPLSPVKAYFTALFNTPRWRRQQRVQCTVTNSNRLAETFFIKRLVDTLWFVRVRNLLFCVTFAMCVQNNDLVIYRHYSFVKS